MDRLKKITLWQWGLLFIFGGLMAGLFSTLQQPTGVGEVARAQALGRAIGTLVPVVVGVGLIVAGVIRRTR